MVENQSHLVQAVAISFDDKSKTVPVDFFKETKRRKHVDIICILYTRLSIILFMQIIHMVQ